MKILLIKMSSLGDVIHTFPAITEAQHHYPELQVDWVVEGAFLDVVTQHHAVRQAIPANLRTWRKQPLRTLTSGTWKQLKQRLRAQHYDRVIDAQGLLKSAAITRLALGPKWGFDRHSAREPLSALVLDKPVTVPRQLHAVERYRSLFAAALGYAKQEGTVGYGIAVQRKLRQGAPNILLCHGTTWANKHWPEKYWRELAELLVAKGWQVAFPHGSAEELARAERLASGLQQAVVLPRMGLAQLFTYMLEDVDASVAGDTGLAHMAAAAGLPGVVVLGPTDPFYTGALAANVTNLGADFHCAPCMSRQCQYAPQEGAIWPPCMASLTPQIVARQLLKNLGTQ